MLWTIIVLIVAIALFLFGGMFIKHDPKKQKTMMQWLCFKSIKLVAIILLIGSVTQLYLTKVNPGIVMDMVASVRVKEEAKQAQAQADADKAIRAFVKDNSADLMKNAPVLGNPEGSKTIFFFTDYKCPYCARAHGELMQVIGENADVRIIVKNMPLPMHGEAAQIAAKAMIAANMQSRAKAANLDKWLVGNFGKWDQGDATANLMAGAKSAGLDTDKLAKDMKSGTVSDELSQVATLAQQFNIQGTPFLIVGETAFPGAVPASQIKAALK